MNIMFFLTIFTKYYKMFKDTMKPPYLENNNSQVVALNLKKKELLFAILTSVKSRSLGRSRGRSTSSHMDNGREGFSPALPIFLL